MAPGQRSFLAAIVAALLLNACTAADPAAERHEVVRHLFSSTLQILVRQPDGVRRTGSGVVVRVDAKTGDVYVVTAAHVLENRKDLLVHVVGQFRRRTYPAEIVLNGKKEDIALLRTRGPRVAAAAIGGDTGLGEDVWVVSYPWGRRRTLVTGIVSQIAWPAKLPPKGTDVPIEGPVRLIDATAAYGTSGGGVFDAGTGALVGIVRGYRTVTVPLPGEHVRPLSLPTGGETTVIPISDIRAFLAANGYGDILPKALPKLPPAEMPEQEE